MTLTEPRPLKRCARELDAHTQQRARVPASLLAVPDRANPTLRRWAQNPSAARR